MYKALSPGAMGLKPANLQETIHLAKTAGFEGVEVHITEVADLIETQHAETVSRMFWNSIGIKPAGWAMPIDWRSEEAKWREGLKQLPRLAKASAAINCHRTFTWVMPCSKDRPFEENCKFHIERFKPISEILGESGIHFGLEFIGPKTLRESQKFPFIHKMADMLAMDAEIGPNMGLLLDCWHWYTSGATVEELRALKPEQVVYVHVNDAPPIPVDEQLDSHRALPGATVILTSPGSCSR